MIDIYRRNTISANQIQHLLLLLILQYMLMVQFNILHVPFSHWQKKISREEVTAILQEKTTQEGIDKDVFTHQIKEAEPLYNPIILEAAELYDVDLTMIKAIIMAESGYNRRSISRNGAGGLMQLMPRTAKSLGVKDIFNPEENINAGVRYYKSLLNRFNGDEKLALAAYNAGARNVKRYKGVPPFKETRQYIRKVQAYQRFYKNGPESIKATSI